MSYKELYEYCQTLKPRVSRKYITSKVLELTGVSSVRVAYTDKLDPAICRGFFIDGSLNGTGPGKWIVMCRGLNYCWTRMVFVKEMMHLFDKKEEMTSSRESFEQLLNDLALPELEEITPQIQSESDAIWMALGCFCPEDYRKLYKTEKSSGLIDNYGIAVRLRIPEYYVQFLLHPTYEEKIAQLIK